MATKSADGGLPEGFQSPFHRVQMQERMDDSLACIATLTGKSLEETWKAALQLGVREHGPYFVYEPMIAKLLMTLGGLVASKYKDFVSFDAMPDVAILLVDYDPATELGRHVLWHHVRAHDAVPSFHYIIDVAQWIPEADQVTTAVKRFKPAYYIEVSQPGARSARAKGAA